MIILPIACTDGKSSGAFVAICGWIDGGVKSERNRIMKPNEDGSYVMEFRTVTGEGRAISVPRRSLLA